MSYNYQEQQKISKIANRYDMALTLGTIGAGIIAPSIFVGKAVGNWSGEEAKDIAVTNVQKEIALITAKQENGQTHKMLAADKTYNFAGTTVTENDFISVPLAELKTEHIKNLNELQEKDAFDAAGGILMGAVVGVVLTGVAMIARHNPIENLSDFLGKKHFQAVNGLKDMFKNNKKSTDKDPNNAADDATISADTSNNNAPKP